MQRNLHNVLSRQPAWEDVNVMSGLEMLPIVLLLYVKHNHNELSLFYMYTY